MKSEGRRVLVTGGAGYVGAVLVPKLLERGYRVRVLDALFFGDEALEGVRQQIELVQGDIRDFDPGVLEGVEAVIHLAGFSNDPTAEANPEANLAINAEGAVNVARAARERGVRRFIQASSCSIYYSHSDYDDDRIRTETTPVHPTAPYSLSKKRAEEGLLELVDESFAPIILRKATIFGFSPRMRYDLVVNTFCRHAFEKGRILLYGGGEMWRPLLHIEDAAAAYIALLEAPEETVKGEIFNLVHKNYRISELGLWFKHILAGKKDVQVVPRYDDLSARARSYRVSSEKLERALGFVPRLGVQAAVEAIWDQLSAGRYTDFDNPRYYNIEWMKRGHIY